jgi:dTDP-glucose 4,6-dehydratase
MTRFLRYSSDLVIWFWTILFKGESCHPYNVGSDRGITIAQLADTVASTLGGSVEALPTSALGNASPSRYVPFIAKAGDELGLQVHIELVRSIASTSSWGSLLE